MVYRVTRTCATLEIFLLDQITFPNIDKKNDEKDREQSLKGWNGTKNYRFIYIYICIYVPPFIELDTKEFPFVEWKHSVFYFFGNQRTFSECFHVDNWL